jgi:hypothetical protein
MEADRKENVGKVGGSFGKKLATKVLENLQFSVNNVHIRFENANQETAHDVQTSVLTAGLVLGEFSCIGMATQVGLLALLLPFGQSYDRPFSRTFCVFHSDAHSVKSNILLKRKTLSV